jgi:hypothetical protein
MRKSNVKLHRKEDALPMKKALRMSLIRKKREKQAKKAVKVDRIALQARAAGIKEIPALTGMMTKRQAIAAAQNRVPGAEAILHRITAAALLRIMRELEGKVIKIHNIRAY